MPQDQNKRWDPSLHIHSIGNEIRSRLRELIETARADLQPRDFAERHLVDELAVCKWCWPTRVGASSRPASGRRRPASVFVDEY